MEAMTAARAPIAQRGDLIIREGPFTIAERDALPDDGYRHELLDGVLVLSPPPNVRHQDIALRVAALLQRHAPRECKVVIAPFEVRLGPRTSIEPDVVVARRTDVGPDRLDGPPLLAVEIASPSTRTIDLGRKMTLLAEAAMHVAVLSGRLPAHCRCTVHKAFSVRCVRLSVCAANSIPLKAP